MERQRNCSCENTEKEREPGRGRKQGERRKDKYETGRDRRRRERELVRGPAVNLRGLATTSKRDDEKWCGRPGTHWQCLVKLSILSSSDPELPLMAFTLEK